MALSADSDRELTAYHEAGHIYVALSHGGRLKHASLEPEEDDGPRRFGDTTITWRRSIREGPHFAKILCEVSLAGPAAEAIYSGSEEHPGQVKEWRADWVAAQQAASVLLSDPRKRLEFLENLSVQIHHALKVDHRWAAIGDIADLLICNDVLEHDDVIDTIRHWGN
jgi:hypothetical protein